MWINACIMYSVVGPDLEYFGRIRNPNQKPGVSFLSKTIRSSLPFIDKRGG
jgi:hypothetical protein